MSERYSMSYTPEAYDDLGDIYFYIAFVLREKRTASRLVKRIRKEISSPAVFPERYGRVEWEPRASTGIHKMSVDHYIIYYQSKGSNDYPHLLWRTGCGEHYQHRIDLIFRPKLRSASRLIT